MFETLTLMIDSSPSVAPAALPRGILSVTSNSIAVNAFLTRHGRVAFWLENAISAAQQEVSTQTAASTAVFDAVDGASLPNDDWFESWIERAPTQGAGRHGSTPLRNEAAFAAERAAV
jgi:hypothetical protein